MRRRTLPPEPEPPPASCDWCGCGQPPAVELFGIALCAGCHGLLRRGMMSVKDVTQKKRGRTHPG